MLKKEEARNQGLVSLDPHAKNKVTLIVIIFPKADYMIHLLSISHT